MVFGKEEQHRMEITLIAETCQLECVHIKKNANLVGYRTGYSDPDDFAQVWSMRDKLTQQKKLRITMFSGFWWFSVKKSNIEWKIHNSGELSARTCLSEKTQI